MFDELENAIAVTNANIGNMTTGERNAHAFYGSDKSRASVGVSVSLQSKTLNGAGHI